MRLAFQKANQLGGWCADCDRPLVLIARTTAVAMAIEAVASTIEGDIRPLAMPIAAGNGGTHLGHLWTASGTQLGEVTFTGETATGWQQATFATPIPISAGTTCVASYYAPTGRYGLNRPYFSSALSAGPLKALADGEEGGNAVLKSGASGFPTKSKEASNSWVDLVFVPGGAG